MRKLIESFFTLCVFKYTTVVILPRMVWGCQESIFSDFPSYRLENKSIWVVCRVEFDGDIRFFLEHQKSMFLLICIAFFDVFCNFFVFQVLQKTWFFFPCRRRAAVAAAEKFSFIFATDGIFWMFIHFPFSTSFWTPRVVWSWNLDNQHMNTSN